MEMVVWYWKGIPREMVGWQSLEAFKRGMDMVLRNMA